MVDTGEHHPELSLPPLLHSYYHASTLKLIQLSFWRDFKNSRPHPPLKEYHDHVLHSFIRCFNGFNTSVGTDPWPPPISSPPFITQKDFNRISALFNTRLCQWVSFQSLLMAIQDRLLLW